MFEGKRVNKKTKNGYYAGMVCLVVFGVLAYCAISSTSSGTAFWIFTIFSTPFGILGFGSLIKPDSIGDLALHILENIRKGEKGGSDSHDKQIQKKSSGVQVMSHDQSKVNIIVNSGKEQKTENDQTGGKEPIKNAKTFCCPNGHPYSAFPPDDIHPIASLEEKHANASASGTIIPILYRCETCGTESKLYWYGKRPKAVSAS